MDPDQLAAFLMSGDVGGGASDDDMRRAFQDLYDIPPTTPGMGDAGGSEQAGSRKRAREEKACREKMRREKIKEMFLELSSVLDPTRPPRADMASILSDASRVLVQLRSEAQELKESNEKLQEAIKELKAEKNEIRDEKMRLKADKDRLEQQVRAMSMPPPGFMPHPIALHPAAANPAAAYAAAAAATQGQCSAKKAVPPFAAFPAGMAMWQWLPPAVVDTTHDTQFWSPNA